MANMNFEDALELALQTTKQYIDNKTENEFSGDYNDLTNRPCYDDREYSEVELTFDGTLDGKETAQFMYYNIPESINDPTIVRLFSTEIIEDCTLIRLSSKPVTYEELYTTTYLCIAYGDSRVELDYTDDDMKSLIIKCNEKVSMLAASGIFGYGVFAINEETDMADAFGDLYIKADRTLSPGIWILRDIQADAYAYPEIIRYTEISSGELKKLDPKFIPDELFELLEPLTEDDIDYIISILDGI